MFPSVNLKKNMEYQIKIHKRVDKFLEFHSFIVKPFFSKMEVLRQDPLDPSLDVKKLQNEENKYRLRIGKYRFLFEIVESQILIDIYDADSR